MQDSRSGSARCLELDQIIILNEEIVALIRAGVPLERGLRQLGSDMPGRLGHVARQLADRLESGDSFVEAISSQDSSSGNSAVFPPVYQAVIAAGVRSGKLVETLEAVAVSARKLSDLRRGMVHSLVYPLLVILVLWAVMLEMALLVLPVFYNMIHSFGIMQAFWPTLSWAEATPLSAGLLVSIPPACILVMAVAWGLMTGRSSMLGAGMGRTLLGWVPGMRRAFRSLSHATMVDVLELMIRQGVPLHEALVPATSTTGDPRMIEQARQVAAQLRQGTSLSDAVRIAPDLPPLVVWWFDCPDQGKAHSDGLRQIAGVYRRFADQGMHFAGATLPLLATALTGLVVLLFYVLLIGLPWLTALHEMSCMFS